MAINNPLRPSPSPHTQIQAKHQHMIISIKNIKKQNPYIFFMYNIDNFQRRKHHGMKFSQSKPSKKKKKQVVENQRPRSYRETTLRYFFNRMEKE